MLVSRTLSSSLLAPLAFLGCGCDSPTTAALGPVAHVAPADTRDIAAMSQVLDGTVAVALRDSRDGLFAIWLMDLTSGGSYAPTGVAGLRYPVALGLSSDREILVLDALAGRFSLILHSAIEGRRELEYEGEFARTAYFDAAKDQWCLNGLFGHEGEFFGQICSRLDSTIPEWTYSLRIPNLPFWVGRPGTEFVSLHRGDRGSWMSACTSPFLYRFDARGVLLEQVDLKSLIPDLVSALDTEGPPNGPPFEYQRWLQSWDCPSFVFEDQGVVSAIVRRSHQRGYEIVNVGVPDQPGMAKALLPAGSGPPFATYQDILVSARPSTNGLPSALILSPLAALEMTISPSEPGPSTVVRPIDIEEWARRSRGDSVLLIVDPETCVGDSLRAAARVSSTLAPSGLSLGVLAPGDDRSSRAFIESTYERVRAVANVGRDVVVLDRIPASAQGLPGVAGIFIYRDVE